MDLVLIPNLRAVTHDEIFNLHWKSEKPNMVALEFVINKLGTRSKVNRTKTSKSSLPFWVCY